VSTAFDPRHPTALALYCSDGRFTHAVEELCRSLGHERFDTVTLPGGPALLTPWPADLSEVFVFSRASHFLIASHHISHVVLLAHENCGFYRSRCPRVGDAEIKQMQLQHLHAASKALTRQHADLETARYYAHVADGRISFAEV
jgi:hypothetical protein